MSALYFSGVTYTTVGYGDLVLPELWRVFAPAEALAGILMSGLSTGLFCNRQPAGRQLGENASFKQREQLAAPSATVLNQALQAIPIGQAFHVNRNQRRADRGRLGAPTDPRLDCPHASPIQSSCGAHIGLWGRRTDQRHIVRSRARGLREEELSVPCDRPRPGCHSLLPGSEYLERRSKAGSTSSRGLALLMGAALDGIPESILGISIAAGGGFSLPFLVAVIVSNFS